MRIDEFLNDRTTEDEEVALDALHVELKYADNGATVEYRWARFTSYPNGGGGSAFELGCPSPARVLAECEAKRRVIEQAGEATSDRYSVIGEFCVGREETQEAMDTDPGDLILRALAAVYRDHPDYNPAWAI